MEHNFDGNTTGGPAIHQQSIHIGDQYGMYLVRQGWECPRCKRINNPDLQQCLCGPPSVAYISTYGSIAGEEFVQQSPIGNDEEKEFEDMSGELSFLTDKPKWDGRWNGLFGPDK